MQYQVRAFSPRLPAHTYSVAFSDNGTPVTTVADLNTFHFTVANYLTLPASLGSPLRSEDATKPGFNKCLPGVSRRPRAFLTAIDIPASIEFDD